LAVIAAAQKIIVSVSNIIAWPLNKLATKAATANKRLIRWAVRKRVGVVYLLAIFWFPVVALAGIILALASVHVQPDVVWPVAITAAVIFFLSKFMLLLTYLVNQYQRSKKALRHYRRHFRSK
jgi:4-amino-4-deoxy-L-arabinose transferase-like glycosyltransferase